MPAPTSSSVDVAALAEAMAVRVRAKSISWRTAASEIGVSPSLLTRLRNGHRPDLEAFAAITRWLGHPADEFLIDPEEDGTREQPPLDSSINALLRARQDLDDSDREFLQGILMSGLRHIEQRQRQGR